MYNYKGHQLLTADDSKDIFSAISDKERIKKVSRQYKNIPLLNSFEIYYNVKLSNDIKDDENINNIKTIEVGNICNGIVTEFTGKRMWFSIPGVKDEIVCKEDFSKCYDAVNNYLLNNNNTLVFEVREHKNGRYVVSVINALYKFWLNRINIAIKNETPITVHIDSLVKGGYMCHTNIDEITEFTHIPYTHSVFIPGSHIVLNIENDFEKWLGKDIEIIPQKFVEFKKSLVDHQLLTENSLVGSRKRLLQIKGQENLVKLYQNWQLSNNENAKVTYSAPTFEGIVTGIINSKKKTGVFVELKDQYITGLMPLKAHELLNYKPGDEVTVTVSEFEIPEDKKAIITDKKGNIIKCNVRLIFTNL